MSNDGGPTGGDLSPSQRTMRARLAAHTMHARHDGREITVNARKAFAERFEHEVDPDGVLPVAEWAAACRARHARAHDMAGAARAAGSR